VLEGSPLSIQEAWAIKVGDGAPLMDMAKELTDRDALYCSLYRLMSRRVMAVSRKHSPRGPSRWRRSCSQSEFQKRKRSNLSFYECGGAVNVVELIVPALVRSLNVAAHPAPPFKPGVVRICISRRNRIRVHADAVYLITDKSLN